MPKRKPKSNSPSDVQQLCVCTAHRCGDVFDPNSNVRGVMLNVKTYRDHQRNDLAQFAKKTRDEAMVTQEQAMINAMERMNIQSQNAPLPDKAESASQGVRITISQISDIMEWCAGMSEYVYSIGPPPAGDVSPLDVTNALVKLFDVRTEILQKRRQSQAIGRGVYRNKAAVSELLNQGRDVIARLLDQVRRHEKLWETVHRQHQEQRAAYIESGITEYDSSHHFKPLLHDVKPFLQIVHLMIVACSIILGLSRRGTHWLYSMAEYLIRTVLLHLIHIANLNIPIPAYFDDVIENFPLDIRTSSRLFDVEGKSTVFAACPKCHSTYAPRDNDGVPTYQEKCNSYEYGSRCKEQLLRPKSIGRRQISVPIKPFVSFDMKDWLANLLSRRGYEENMDTAWTRMDQATPGASLKDIFHGSIIRDFKSPDGIKHFNETGDKDAGRYLFSLGADFFNPLRNLTAGKKVSIGIIALACLNLPIEIRYLPENMFLAGIIPGPSEPKLGAVNHYMQPLVDTLLMFWKGVLFSATALHPLGRLIFCALVALVCDLPAARKFGGFAGHSHERFCSMCECNSTQHTFNNYEYDSWIWRTKLTCRTSALKYKLAPTQAKADSSFDRTGVRWSELLRLPYFDPSKMIVVDPMHNLFLGLIKEHFQSILGHAPSAKNKNKSKGKGKGKKPDVAPSIQIPVSIINNPLHKSKDQRASVRKLTSILEGPKDSTKSLESQIQTLGSSAIHQSAFVYIARGLGLIPLTVNFSGYDDDPNLSSVRLALTTHQLAGILLRWKYAQPEIIYENSVDEVRGSVFSDDELSALHHDLKHTIKPSWVSSVPTTLSSSGPKLKSDQWRSVGSLYLPITLIRLWTGHEDENRQDLLRLTMRLCSAIAVATSRVTSQAHADQYLIYMTEYREELKKKFPKYKCHPNHHVAFHITELLTMYGPVHGWWTFPFERMIGMLQRISTNYKEGEYESTISRTWSRKSNFHAIFTKINCPPFLQSCYDLFATLVRAQNRNSLALNPGIDVEDTDEQVLEIPRKDSAIPTDIMTAINQSSRSRLAGNGKILKRITQHGITYTTRSIHEGNSGIMRKGSLTPFVIENIVVVQGATEPWLVVRRHKVARINNDPYLAHPHLRMRIWDPDLESTLEAFPVDEVDGQYAKCPIEWEENDTNHAVIVVASLSRVVLV